VYRGSAGDGKHHHFEQRAATEYIGAIKWKKQTTEIYVKKSNVKNKYHSNINIYICIYVYIYVYI